MRETNKYQKLEELLTNTKVPLGDLSIDAQYKQSLKSELYNEVTSGSKSSSVWSQIVALVNTSYVLGVAFVLLTIFVVINFDERTLKSEVVAASIIEIPESTIVKIVRSDPSEVITAVEGDIVGIGDVVEVSGSATTIISEHGDKILADNNAEFTFLAQDEHELTLRQFAGSMYIAVSDTEESKREITVAVRDSILTTESGAEFLIDIDEETDNIEVFKASVDIMQNSSVVPVGQYQKVIISPESNEVSVSELDPDANKRIIVQKYRKQLEETGAVIDRSPPVIELSTDVSSPSQSRYLQIDGKLNDDSMIRKIKINSHEYYANDGNEYPVQRNGQFSIPWELEEGDNELTLYAYDEYWNTSSILFTLTYEPREEDLPVPTEEVIGL